MKRIFFLIVISVMTQVQAMDKHSLPVSYAIPHERRTLIWDRRTNPYRYFEHRWGAAEQREMHQEEFVHTIVPLFNRNGNNFFLNLLSRSR